MPYASLKDINPALKGIKPKISLTQANLIAKWADAMERAEDGPESAWAVAIAQFKKLYRVEGGKWVKKKQKESGMEYKAYTTSTNNVMISVNAIDVGGEAVPVAELIAAYLEQRDEDDDADLGEVVETAEMDIDKVKGLLQEVLAMLDAPAEIEEVQLSESAVGHAVALTETEEITGGPRAPLLLDFALMRPGRGNKKDNHYYPREVLERDAHVFEGVKMYATDHRQEEKNVRTEVGIVKMCPLRFEEDGTPIGRASIFNPDFAEQVRNRAKAGVLDSLENSILGVGKTKSGEAPDGEKAKIVEAITKGISVDFVTKGGAGGQARALIENDGGEIMSEQDKEKDEKAEETSQEEAQTQEAVLAEQEQAQQEEAPQTLAEEEVGKAVDATKLPDFAKAALKARQYADEAELQEAVESATKEVAKLTGSGQPFGQGGGAAPGKEQMSEADYEAEYAEILRRHGLHVPQQQEVA